MSCGIDDIHRVNVGGRGAGTGRRGGARVVVSGGQAEQRGVGGGELKC